MWLQVSDLSTRWFTPMNDSNRTWHILLNILYLIDSWGALNCCSITHSDTCWWTDSSVGMVNLRLILATGGGAGVRVLITLRILLSVALEHRIRYLWLQLIPFYRWLCHLLWRLLSHLNRYLHWLWGLFCHNFLLILRCMVCWLILNIGLTHIILLLFLW